jgi:hypothetical protein
MARLKRLGAMYGRWFNVLEIGVRFSPPFHGNLSMGVARAGHVSGLSYSERVGVVLGPCVTRSVEELPQRGCQVCPGDTHPIRMSESRPLA